MRPPTIPTTIPVNRDDTKQVVIMKSLYNSLIEYREPKSHRILIQLFMCLPSRKDFPEYFNIIAKPIAMNKIRERIERQQYLDEESCMEDFKLMFTNCKFFNEDDSQIYKDAVLLEGILAKRKDQLLNEHFRPSRDSKETAKEAINNATTPSSALNSNSSPSIKSERLNNQSSITTNNHVTPTETNHSSTNNNKESSTSPSKQQDTTTTTTNNNSNNSNSSTTTVTTTTTTTSITATTTLANNIANSNNHSTTSTNSNLALNHNSDSTTARPSGQINNGDSNNGVANIKDTIIHQSDSTNHSSTDQQNGNEELESANLKINHNHHNETSMDSGSNLSADLLASTPVEKCSLNTRRGRNSDAPKRQLLTGYIIYASEIRKQVIDKNPNQNFGDISRLVGNEWKALPYDIRSKYDERALIHNRRVRERAQRELHGGEGRLSNGLHTPKMTKRKQAKLSKEEMRKHHLGHNDSSLQTPRVGQELSSSMVSQTPSSTYKHLHPQHSQPQTNLQATSSKITTVESSTQTTAIRFVEPPTKKRLVYSDSFKKYIEGLQIPNKDLLAEETTPDRPPELPTHWLGTGIGRHESAEAALWALRDFMLQDAVTMRRSMEPYL